MIEVIFLQARVIGALVLRETRATFGTSQIGYLWAIIIPGASISVLVFIFSFMGRHPPFGSSFALFFATGVLILEMFNKLSSSLMTVFEANRALLAYPPIKETDVLFARSILIAATYVVIMVIVFSGLIQLKMAEFPASIDKVMEAIMVTVFLGFGFGTLNAVVVSLWDSWRHIEKILTRPLFFLSGVFYVPSHLPSSAISILEWNPVLHCVEWMRNGFYPNYDSTVLDRGFLMETALALILFGLAGERLFRQRRGSG